MRFLAAFALWATLLFVPAWWAAHAWQHALAAVATRIVAPAGTTIEMLDLELFYPVDLAVFVALCLASAWAPWGVRARAALVGAPVLVVAELAALSLALIVLLHASAPGVDAADREGAGRLADGLIRVSGLAVALVAWFAALGRDRLAAWRRTGRGLHVGARVGLVAVALALGALGPRAAAAHGVGSGQIELTVDGARIDGGWSLDLKDARTALGLDPTLTGTAGAADLRAMRRRWPRSSRAR